MVKKIKVDNDDQRSSNKTKRRSKTKSRDKLPKMERRQTAAGKLKMLFRAPAKLFCVLLILVSFLLVQYEFIELEHELLTTEHNPLLYHLNVRWIRFKRRTGLEKLLKKLEPRTDINDSEVSKIQNKNLDELWSHPQCDDSSIKELDSNDKFFLPILYFDVGPNNLFRIFKEAIPIAKELDRTLVIPPFHRHPRMEGHIKSNNQSDKYLPMAYVPIFDQDYIAKLEIDGARTMDVNCLKKKVPAVPFSQFETACNNKIELLIECADIDLKRRKGIKYFTGATHLKILKTDTVIRLDNQVHFKTLARNIEHIKCVGIAIGRKCLGDRDRWLQEWKDYSPFVQRPPEIRDIARSYIKDEWKNQKFVAMHWRYDAADWNDMCKDTRPDAAKSTNGEICKFVNEMQMMI